MKSRMRLELIVLFAIIGFTFGLSVATVHDSLNQKNLIENNDESTQEAITSLRKLL